jgi:thiamine-monophosphate kinase
MLERRMSRHRPTESFLVGKIERVFGALGGRSLSRGKVAPGNRLALGIGDDAALFRPLPGSETILTCDWFLEGTHFLRDKHPADSVGWKCLARATSDIAAMGGTPRCFLLSLAIPEWATGAWLEGFLRGLRRAAQRFECVLAGGDTTRAEHILIHVAVIGEVDKRRALRRRGARAGDLLFVSGRLGEAERGWQIVRKQRGMADRRDQRLQKHLYPQPRLALAAWLARKRLATAAMDLSDGLSSDLPRLCAASGVGARIDATKLPLVVIAAPRQAETHKLPRQRDEALELALHGGDEYELLFTVPRRKELKIPPSFAGVPLLSIGEITRSRRIVVVGQNSRPQALKPGGWDPFR